MDADEIRDDIAHQNKLLAEHKKHMKTLELQAAKFGLHVPSYISIEINDLNTKIRQCEREIVKLKKQLIGSNIVGQNNEPRRPIFEAPRHQPIARQELRDPFESLPSVAPNHVRHVVQPPPFKMDEELTSSSVQSSYYNQSDKYIYDIPKRRSPYILIIAIILSLSLWVLFSMPNPVFINAWKPHSTTIFPTAITVVPDFDIKSTWTSQWGELTLENVYIRDDRINLEWKIANTTSYDISFPKYYFLIDAYDNNSNVAFDLSYDCLEKIGCEKDHIMKPNTELHYTNAFTINYEDKSLHWIRLHVTDALGVTTQWYIPIPDR